jgi:ketosteroid isomerase-like protein
MPSETERAVLMANAAFYDAFGQRDPGAMAAIWADTSPVTCVHPGWDVLVGRDAVLASWNDILSQPTAPPITCTNAVVYLYGETASVVCMERLPTGLLVATNVFVREAGRWRMVHHHAGPVATRISAADDGPPPRRTVH